MTKTWVLVLGFPYFADISIRYPSSPCFLLTPEQLSTTLSFFPCSHEYYKLVLGFKGNFQFGGPCQSCNFQRNLRFKFHPIVEKPALILLQCIQTTTIVRHKNSTTIVQDLMEWKKIFHGGSAHLLKIRAGLGSWPYSSPIHKVRARPYTIVVAPFKSCWIHMQQNCFLKRRQYHMSHN